MTHALKSISVAIGDLTSHPANVRSNSPETYETEAIAHLTASIGVLGIIQPLLGSKDRWQVRRVGRWSTSRSLERTGRRQDRQGLHQQNQDRMPLGAGQLRCDHGPLAGREHHPSPDERYRRVRGVCAYDGSRWAVT